MYIGDNLTASQKHELITTTIEAANGIADDFLGDSNASYLREYLTFDDVTIEPRPLMVVSSRTDVDPTVPYGHGLLQRPHLPILGASMEFMRERFAINLYNAGGLHILPRVGLSKQERLDMLKAVVSAGAKAGIAVGIKDDKSFIEDVLSIDKTLPVISVDVAHGAAYHVFKYVLDTIVPSISHNTSTSIILGNVGSLAGYVSIDLFSYILGINHRMLAKVGVGPGAACTTRINTGVGVGQFSLIKVIDTYRKSLLQEISNDGSFILKNAIEDVVLKMLSTTADGMSNKSLQQLINSVGMSTSHRGIKVISDGGVEKPGDFVKALAAGADYVMMGKFFVSPDFSGEFIEKEGKKYFTYYGMASKKAKNGRDDYVEGAVLNVPVRWKTTEDAVKALEYGLRSAMTYSDSVTLSNFKDLVRIVRNTFSSINEGGPRGNLIDS